jgi:uncharacterized protein (DUF2141 family)
MRTLLPGRLGWALPVALAALTMLSALAPVAAPAQEAVAEAVRRVLWINVYTRNDEGRVFCAIWRGREGYPTERARNAGEGIARTIRDGRARLYIDDVTPGEYAAACFHDENANNDLDQGLFGIPTEGTGASNGARGMMGPPPYDQARFEYPADADNHQIGVRIVYGW